MILHGDIRVTNDINEMKSLMFTHKIIFIGEPDDQLVQATNAIKASLFVPPYNIIVSEMEGRPEEFIRNYLLYLSGRECSEYIALIIRALYDGTNILLYLTQEESEMMYSNVLFGYLKDQYGITISYGSMPASFNDQYAGIICDFLFSADLMTVQEFFGEYPENVRIGPMNIPKLVSIINPYVLEQTLEAYITCFDKLKMSIKQNSNMYLNNLIELV